MRALLINTISITAGFLIAFKVGAWAIEAAERSRGYSAIGGEYILIPFAFWGAWMICRATLRIAWMIAEEKLRRRKKRYLLIKKYQVRSSRT